MTAAALQQIRPVGVRAEALALTAAAIAVIGALGLWVHKHGREADREQIYEWQVSAFDTLTGPDQAIYNALYTAKDEIVYLYDDINMLNGPGQRFRWPGIQDMEDALLPPIYKDRSWEQNGSLRWTLHEPLSEGEMQGSVMYVGTDGKVAGQGSFLLIIGHVHAGFTNNNSIVIWWNAKNHVEMPQSGYKDSLILQGWREVIPHSGAAEIKRLFGKDPNNESQDAQTADKIAEELFGK